MPGWLVGTHNLRGKRLANAEVRILNLPRTPEHENPRRRLVEPLWSQDRVSKLLTQQGRDMQTGIA